MIRFYCDYALSAHPRILDRIQALREMQHPGYGEDEHCQRAADYIRAAAQAPQADVHFLVSGTQTNTVLISSILRPHQGVLAAHTGHIATHENNAIESTGHRVITVPGREGKLTAAQIREVYDKYWSSPVRAHTVQPGLVFLSHPTESGTVYSLAELEAISQVCKACNLLLMLDGARLGYGLAAAGGDVTLADVARLCDVFYIGGTKLGTLFGEAVVIQNPQFKPDFRSIVKRHGGLLAKGFLLGIQFECMFEDGLYFELGRHGVQEAMRLRQGFLDAGLSLQYDTGTNQQFPLIPDALCEKLKESFTFAQWEKPDAAHTVVRFCTSWATRPEEVDALISALRQK